MATGICTCVEITWNNGTEVLSKSVHINIKGEIGYRSISIVYQQRKPTVDRGWLIETSNK